MNYENLKDAIIAVIKQNGNEEITGDILQQVLVAMVNSLGSGYQFRGIATPETNPGTPDQRVFYLASATGTYADFGVIVSDEICALVYDTAWHKQTIVALDQEPTEDSGNLISSGAIYTALQNLADVYMKLVEDADEDHIATFDENGQVKDSELSLNDVAKAKGAFPQLFAGFAGNLVDTRSAGTRQGPFAFRQSGGDGVNYMRKILGRTEAFNQLFPLSPPMSASGLAGEVTIVDNGDGSYTLNGTTTAQRSVIFYGVAHSGRTMLYDLGGSFTGVLTVGDGYTGGDAPLVKAGARTTSMYLYIASGVTLNNVVIRPNTYDLTLEGLGLTTAAQFRALHPLGYYSPASKLINNAATRLETTGFNKWDEQWEVGGYIIGTGAPYGYADRIRSKNAIPVFPSTQYYFSDSNTHAIFFYDAGGNYISDTGSVGTNIFTTPANCAFIKFNLFSTYGTTYNHDICINLSDASRNGEYEPYWKRDIVLGLNNLACHDEQNNAVVVNGLDGVGTSQDELIVENGWGTKINKKRARVDLGSLSWQRQSGFTDAFYASIPGGVGSNSGICPKYVLNVGGGPLSDKEFVFINNNIYIKDSAFDGYMGAQVAEALQGVMLDYELATPKVLTLDNPIPALIEVDNLGTEKRLPEDTADNPQGPFECDSNYSISTANLVRKLSEL